MTDRPKHLNVWLRGELVAQIDDQRDLPLRYVGATLNEKRGQPVLSCSLPVSNRPTKAKAFFDGVLPEGIFRSALASKANVVANDTFGLVAHYGRDILGAVVVDVADRSDDRTPGVVDLSKGELADEVANLPERPLGVYDDSELSIPGLQNKMLLVRTDTGWARPIHGTPSTHILKLDSQAHPGVVASEVDAMTLAKAVNLTTVGVQLETLASVACIIVERFDRITDDHGQTERIHQEDICQALGYPPERKYELPGRGGGTGGGPEFADVAALLDRHALSPVDELDKLAQTAVFTALIGNNDAHGKNLALLHRDDSSVSLAPLYDTVPTTLFPKLKYEAAMTIGGAVDLADVTPKALRTEAKHWNFDPERMVEQGKVVAERMLTEVQALPKKNGLRQLAAERAERFLEDAN